MQGTSVKNVCLFEGIGHVLHGLTRKGTLLRNQTNGGSRVTACCDKSLDFKPLLRPACREEGKLGILVAFGYISKRYRAVTKAKTVTLRLAEVGGQVSIGHCELNLEVNKEA